MAQARVARVDAETDHPADSRPTAGARLYSLCQSASADGALNAHERARLRAWLDRGESLEIPAQEYVRALIEQVLSAGCISAGELQALGRALEPVLPQELTRRWPAALRLVGHLRRRPGLAAERRPNEILASACFLIATGHAGRRGERAARGARGSDAVLLVRRRGSSLGPHAIEVRIPGGRTLGYVPEVRARELAPLLDRGARYRAHLVSVFPGEPCVLIAQAFLYGSDARLGFDLDGARGVLARKPSRLAWTALRIAVALGIAAGVAAALHA